jgi:hypothetical protein
LTHSDALAFNVGSEDWQQAQVASAYAAAQSAVPNSKLFFNFTTMPCDVTDFISSVNRYKKHPN